MNNRRNKLLLSLAKKRKQSDIFNSEYLSTLIDSTNSEDPSEVGSTDLLLPVINDELLPPIPAGCDTLENLEVTECFGSDKLELLGDDTLKKNIDDVNHTDKSMSCFNIEDLANEDDNNSQYQTETLIQLNDLLEVSREEILSPISKSRSVTPVPSNYVPFGSSLMNKSPNNKNPGTIINEDIDQIQAINHESESTETFIYQCESANTLTLRAESPFQSTSATTSAAEASSECSTPSTTSHRKRRKFHIDTSKKKRKCMRDNWLDTKRKLLVNRGKAHLSRGGKEQQGKLLKPGCENCKFNCCTKITPETRKQLFDLFWGLGNHAKQWQFIGRHTKRFTKKRITTENSNRNYSVHYFLPIGADEGNMVKICKIMFKNTLNISNQFIQSGIDKYNNITGACENDKRGVHCNQKKVLTEAVIKGVCEHVNSFKPVESHYIRKDSNKMYLDGDLTFVKMFKMYHEWTAENNNIQDKVGTLRQYRDVVNSHLNIGFYLPKKDQCDICTAHKNNPNDTDSSNIDFMNHIQNKNIARSLKSEDKKLAQSKPTEVATVTFDFQKILSSPHGETSSYYYKRKLSVFNFTIFDTGNKRGICYMWDETIAKRGSNEVASCLYDHITKIAVSGIKDIRLWSDNCGGQNRNRSVFSMYLYAAKLLKVHVCHRFLEKGHTQQEGDSVHALIERSSKRKMIYTPLEWYTCVRWCKVNEKPYEVIEVSANDILDFKSHTNQYTWTKNLNNEKVKWNQIREIKVDPSDPYVMHYKYDLNEAQSMSIDCRRRAYTRNRQNNVEPLNNAYTNALPITTAKYKDLISLCEKNLIPSRYHSFYKNIAHTATENKENTNSDEED